MEGLGCVKAYKYYSDSSMQEKYEGSYHKHLKSSFFILSAHKFASFGGRSHYK